MKTAVISCSAACFLRLSTLNVLHAEAADVTVGGSSGWANGIQYGPLQGQQGDVLVSQGYWSEPRGCKMLQMSLLYSLPTEYSLHLTGINEGIVLRPCLS